MIRLLDIFFAILGLLVLGPLSSVWGAPKVLTYSSRSVFVEASDDQGAEAHELAEMQCQKNGLHAYNTGRPDGPKGSYIFFACARSLSFSVEIGVIVFLELFVF